MSLDAHALAGAIRIHRARGETSALLTDLARTACVSAGRLGAVIRNRPAKVAELAGVEVRTATRQVKRARGVSRGLAHPVVVLEWETCGHNTEGLQEAKHDD
jgi:hypothetical protein